MLPHLPLARVVVSSGIPDFPKHRCKTVNSGVMQTRCETERRLNSNRFGVRDFDACVAREIVNVEGQETGHSVGFIVATRRASCTWTPETL